MAIVSRSYDKSTIIFSQTKQEAHRLKIIMGLSDIKAGELHGDMTQTQRLAALEGLVLEVDVDPRNAGFVQA